MHKLSISLSTVQIMFNSTIKITSLSSTHKRIITEIILFSLVVVVVVNLFSFSQLYCKITGRNFISVSCKDLLYFVGNLMYL